MLLVTGCDVVFRLDDVHGGGSADSATSGADVPADVGLVGDRPWFCQDTQVFDDMSGTTPCTWGAVIQGSSLSQHDGVLDIGVTPSTPVAFYGCTGYGPWAALSDDGVFAKVDAPLQLPGSYTKLDVRSPANAMPYLDANITYSGALRFYVNGVEVATDSMQPPATWWRIRNPQGTDLFVAELSMDGQHWRQWAQAQSAMPAQIAVDLGAGVTQTPTTTTKATVSALGICR